MAKITVTASGDERQIAVALREIAADMDAGKRKALYGKPFCAQLWAVDSNLKSEEDFDENA